MRHRNCESKDLGGLTVEEGVPMCVDVEKGTECLIHHA